MAADKAVGSREPASTTQPQYLLWSNHKQTIRMCTTGVAVLVSFNLPWDAHSALWACPWSARMPCSFCVSHVMDTSLRPMTQSICGFKIQRPHLCTMAIGTASADASSMMARSRLSVCSTACNTRRSTSCDVCSKFRHKATGAQKHLAGSQQPQMLCQWQCCLCV